ncbi:MAG TPA: DSD1 family PLP-dependent enzyme [Methylibium sp.]|nr:DSD1 family PLP-dependent enzyme [Methylibium sp.]
MRRPPAEPGDPVAAIDTPALVVDADALDRNLARMAAFARERGLRLRPHAKTHKCAAIGLAQVALGAVGLCVQKVGEAEALAAGGLRDLFISNEVIAAAKLARLAALARGTPGLRLAIAVDSAFGVERLARAAQGIAIDVFVELDVGQRRCGVEPAEAGALARRVVDHGLRFAGLHAYHGRAQHLRSAAERAAAIGEAVVRVRAAQAALGAAGLDCPLVTGAGSGSFALEAASGVYGELQPGSYVFMDADYARNAPTPGAPRFEQALFVKAQVMSAAPGRSVVDAGHKSHAIESGLPTVWGRDDLEVASAHDEHATLLPRGAGALPALGDTVWLVPGHCDPTVNLHTHLVAVRGGLARGVVEAVWPVDARGAFD